MNAVETGDGSVEGVGSAVRKWVRYAQAREFLHEDSGYGFDDEGVNRLRSRCADITRCDTRSIQLVLSQGRLVKPLSSLLAR
jgi:hypothetical protein